MLHYISELDDIISYKLGGWLGSTSAWDKFLLGKYPNEILIKSKWVLRNKIPHFFLHLYFITAGDSKRVPGKLFVEEKLISKRLFHGTLHSVQSLYNPRAPKPPHPLMPCVTRNWLWWKSETKFASKRNITVFISYPPGSTRNERERKRFLCRTNGICLMK